MLCLAADYSQPGNTNKLWWQGDNAIERWSGPSVDRLQLEVTARRTGRVWTAPSVFPYRHDVVCMAGLNDDGPIPDQHLCYLDPYSLEVEHGRSMPPPPKGKAFKGATAWRDPSICAWNDQYLLTATSGGFRWGCKPNVFGYTSTDPRGPWDSIGPLLDPALAVLFAELEKPQVLRLQDGRFAMLASCWPERQFVRPNAQPLHLFVSAWDEPIFSRYLGTINVSQHYGMNLSSGHWCGWRWIKYEDASSDCVVIKTNDTIDAIVTAMEGR